MKTIKFSRRMILNIYSITILAAFLIIIFFSYHQLKSVSAASQWVKHTNQVIEKVDNILLNYIEAESLTRGYLLSGDVSMIEMVEEKIKVVLKNYNDAKNLTIDNPDQQALFINLEPLLTSRITILKKLLNIKLNDGLQTNLILQLVHQGQSLTEQTKDVIEEILQNEALLLQQREDMFKNYFKVTRIASITVGIFFLSLIVLIIILLNKMLSDMLLSQNLAKKSEFLLKGVINGSNEYIAALDLDYNVTACNKAFEAKFHEVFGRMIAVGMNVKDALAYLPKEQKKAIDIWSRALNGEEFTVIEKFGSEEENQNYFEISYSSIYNEENKLIGASHIARDISKRISAENKLLEINKKLVATLSQVENQAKEMLIINDMNNKIRSSSSMEETLSIITLYLKRLLPFCSGIIYLMNHSRNFLEAVTEWNNPGMVEKIFAPDQCWGLRQGKNYFFINSNESVPCQHVILERRDLNDTLLSESSDKGNMECNSIQNNLSSVTQSEKFNVKLLPSICVPLLALNEVIGILYLQITDAADMTQDEICKLYEENNLTIQNISGQISLAIWNIKLKEVLKTQSTRDSLTNLYNRSFLNETFERDIQRAKRNKTSLAVVMMDLDFFKSINDSFGHKVGDMVLRDVSLLLTNQLRKGDIACRYGGEEFLIIFYDITLQETIAKIEQLRKKIADLKFHFIDLITVNASFGIAMFPEDGNDPEQLIKTADNALYQSKKEGRNRTTYRNETRTIE